MKPSERRRAQAEITDALGTFLATLEAMRDTPGGLRGLSASLREAATSAESQTSAEHMRFWTAFAELVDVTERTGLVRIE